MNERKYSVSEIDQMREAVGWLSPEKAVEDRLRTYMLNGTSPAELQVAKEEFIEARRKRQEAEREERLARQRVCDHVMTHEGRGNFSECVLCGLTKRDEVRK